MSVSIPLIMAAYAIGSSICEGLRPVFAATLKLFGYVSLGSIVSVGAFPFFVWAGGRLGWTMVPSPAMLAASALVPLLIILKHSDNLGRLIEGKETRIGAKGWDPKGEVDE